MNIIALDPATKMGWAHNASKSIKHGSEDFSNSKWDSSGTKFLKFRSWLKGKFDLFPSDKKILVVYESVESHSSTYAAHCYGGWVAIMQELSEEYKNIEYTGAPVKTIKKFWTGKGTASKTDMIRVAREQGFNPKDDNAADAIAILHWGIDQFS